MKPEGRPAAWYFPDLEGPDLSFEIVEGEFDAEDWLEEKSVYEIALSADDEEEHGESPAQASA